MTKKRFKLLYSKLNNGMFVDREKQFEDVIVDKEFQKIGLIKVVDLLNKLADENNRLKQFQEQVASVIESKMGDNVCNDYKMEVLKEIWSELKLDKVWFK